MSHPAQDYAPPLRIGVVTYLNAKPLVHGLEAMLPKAQISYDLPSRLADRLTGESFQSATARSYWRASRGVIVTRHRRAVSTHSKSTSPFQEQSVSSSSPMVQESVRETRSFRHTPNLSIKHLA